MIEVQWLAISTLKPNPRNSRTHPKKQIGQIAESIRRFGWTTPLLTDEHGTILAGHGRFTAAQSLGQREVPVIVKPGLTELEKRALMLADNKIAANAGWDRNALAAELGELVDLLPECEIGIEITGFEAAEVDGLLGDLSDSDADPADDQSFLEPHAVSEAGDLWRLGSHACFAAMHSQLPTCANSWAESARR